MKMGFIQHHFPIAVSSVLTMALTLAAVHSFSPQPPGSPSRAGADEAQAYEQRLAAALQKIDERQQRLAQSIDKLEQALQRRDSGGPRAAAACPAAVDPEAIAEAVAVRLKQGAQPSGPAPAAVPEAQDEELSPEQQAAVDQANSIVDAALAAGRWTNKDVLQVVEVLQAAGNSTALKEARKQLRLRILQALNRKELIPENPTNVLP